MLHDSLQEFTPNAHVAVNGNEAKGVLAEGTVVRFSPERPGSPARIVIKSGEPPQEDSGCLYEFFYDRGSFGWRFAVGANDKNVDMRSFGQ